MLVPGRRPDVARLADHIWYPMWDEGLHVGHSVCTVREALALAADDLDTATALLSARHVAGDPQLTDELARQSLAQWERRSKRWLTAPGGRGGLRHGKAGGGPFPPRAPPQAGRGGT